MNIDKQDERLLHEILSKYKQGLISGILQGDNITLTPTGCRNKIISSTGGGGGGSSALFPNGLAIIESSRDFQASDEGKLLVLFPGVNLTMPNSIVFTGLFRTIGIMQIDTTSWFEQEFGGTKIKSLTTAEFKHNEIVLCLTSVTDDDSASRLLFLSTTIIEEQTALKHLYDKSQNAIPLSGTEVGSPVTGDIDFANANIIFNNIDGDKFIKFGFNTATDETGLYFDNGLDPQTRFSIYNGDIQCYMPIGSYFSFANDYLGFSNNGNSSFVGIRGGEDYSNIITDLDYTQKIYVGFRGTATLSSGTVTVTTDKIKTGYKIYLSVNTPSGTQGFLSAPTGSIVNETEFVINSTSATDDSTVNWWIAP